MAKSRGPSQTAVMRKLAKKPFGPWEKRIISVAHAMRPILKTSSEKWREECYLNNRYSVQLSDYETDWGTVVHLWIRRHDGTMPRSWADLQRIKDEIVDSARVAIEVFPPAKELVDEANMGHLWVLPEDFVLPFTLRGKT